MSLFVCNEGYKKDDQSCNCVDIDKCADDNIPMIAL